MKHSRRAVILAKVLEYINNDDWVSRDGFLIFGMEAFEISMGELSGEHTELDDAIRDFATKFQVNKGDRAIAKRISLHNIPKDSSEESLLELLSKLSKEQRTELQDSLRSNAASPNRTSSGQGDGDTIDAALAFEAIRNLDDTLARITTFDEMSFGEKPNRSAEYFEEAHRCDLSGLRIASAVLCRAVLEAALIETIDPNLKIKSGLNSKGGHIGAMIHEAAKLHLDQERVKAARDIHQAGNTAIHDLAKFKKEYAPRMRYIVDNLRKVIIDLYE
ncbi:MAG TPA: DUF4145 domain-containing protein [Terracidiphilus sp.]|jgi:hypothetical protein